MSFIGVDVYKFIRDAFIIDMTQVEIFLSSIYVLYTTHVLPVFSSQIILLWNIFFKLGTLYCHIP